MTALIYTYYEVGIPIDEAGNKKYKCKVCELIGEKTKKGDEFYCNAMGTTTSNLINHLKKQSHSSQHAEYVRKVQELENLKTNSPANKKRKINETTAQPTPKSPSMFGSVSSAVKYTMNSIIQKFRYILIFYFILKILMTNLNIYKIR